MFKRLSKVGFKIVPDKYKFFRKEVDFLGFVVGIYRVRIDLEKVRSILE